MLCGGKYYLGCGPNLQVQVSKETHEQIRLMRGDTLLELKPEDPVRKIWVWIDDPNCDEVITHLL